MYYDLCLVRASWWILGCFIPPSYAQNTRRFLSIANFSSQSLIKGILTSSLPLFIFFSNRLALTTSMKAISENTAFYWPFGSPLVMLCTFSHYCAYIDDPFSTFCNCCSHKELLCESHSSLDQPPSCSSYLQAKHLHFSWESSWCVSLRFTGSFGCMVV